MDAIFDFIFTVLWAPFAVFVGHPFRALIPVALFAGSIFSRWSRSAPQIRILLAVCGAAWLTFAIYEHKVSSATRLASIPIRVDMLLLSPLLYAPSIAGIVAWWRLMFGKDPR